MNTPEELARELVRRGCRIEVRQGAPWVVPPDALTAAWAKRHAAYLAEHGEAIVAAVRAGAVPAERPPPAGTRCHLCRVTWQVSEAELRLLVRDPVFCDRGGCREGRNQQGRVVKVFAPRCPFKES